mgnify:CR=1 FL=1
MFIDVATANHANLYQALVGIVSPRPIAWVSTVDREDRPNLAPFSFYNTFGSNPPVVVFGGSFRRAPYENNSRYWSRPRSISFEWHRAQPS